MKKIKIKKRKNYYLVYIKKTEIFKCYDVKTARRCYSFLAATQEGRAGA